MIVQCPQLSVACPVRPLSFHGSGGGDHCEKLWSGFDSALWGLPWGGPGAAQWDPSKTAGGETSVARLLVQLLRSYTRPPDAWHWSLKRGSTSLTAESCIAWSKARLVPDEALRQNAPALSAPSPPEDLWEKSWAQAVGRAGFRSSLRDWTAAGVATGLNVLNILGMRYVLGHEMQWSDCRMVPCAEPRKQGANSPRLGKLDARVWS